MLLRTAVVAMIMLVSIITTAPVVAEPEGASSTSAEPEQPQTFTQQVGAWRFWHSQATETSLCHRLGLLAKAICVIY